MKAVILAGGSGTRLYPCTQFINKHFLPIYNKPMLFYPISLAMLLKIRDIIFVINKDDENTFKILTHKLSKMGLNSSYAIQMKPRGIADGLLVAKPYTSDDSIFLILGDNILYAHDLVKILNEAKASVENSGGAYIFGYYVHDPHRYGIIEFDSEGRVISIEEKPKEPRSHYAVIGVYFFDSKVFEIAGKVKPSHRGELEITSVLEEYLRAKSLRVKLFGRGFAWFDAGTYDSFLEAGEFVATIERKTGLMIGCLEEIAYRNEWIDKQTLLEFAKSYGKTSYGKYLTRIAEEDHHAL